MAYHAALVAVAIALFALFVWWWGGNGAPMDAASKARVIDTLRLRLKALTHGATTELTLLLPRQAIESAQLESGQTISAQQRPYGLALATLTPAGAMGPFFLLLDDDWYRELESRPVAIDHASEA